MKNRKVSILIVDDERSIRLSLYHWFTREDYEVSMAKDAHEALSMIYAGNFDIILADIKMPGMDGIEMNRRIQNLNSDAVVIIMTAFASVETAVTTLKDGAYDYITKPFDPEELSKLIKDISGRILLKAKKHGARTKGILLENIDDIIGESDAMLKILKQVKNIATSSTPVLITGEQETGKELIAKVIHNNSSRKYAPMVTVHCGALSNQIAASTLFGHEKGAFPGALSTHVGYFESLNDGTILLDEIGDISPEIQTTLMRVLETKTFFRIGGNQEIKTNFRLICTTKTNLKEKVLTQQFREDLYYRLNIANIHIPPLRERQEDIPLLIDFFLNKQCEEMSKKKFSVHPSVIKHLQQYNFPGNVRELKNMIEQAVLLCEDEEINLGNFPAAGYEEEQMFENLLEHEKKYIDQILISQNWNITKSARILNIDRVTLYNKIKKYQLEQKYL